MQDSAGQKYVSVFKPVDEEPMAVNNPQGLPLSPNGEGLKKGTRVGEGHSGKLQLIFWIIHMEVHARFVVMRMALQASHLQSWRSVSMVDSTTQKDMGPRAFPVEEVHKICVLDIRLANADRHAGNILIQKDGEGQIVLIPIDHGYCMPENFEDCTFEWLYWPQAREPFSPKEIAYINSLDAAKDIEILKFNGWNVPDNCARVFRISTMLLKKGTERGLTPFAIGSIMCRETVKKESVIER
ncbi:hypothetical protein SASPL_155924 [Salvia splendens]|uniref:1-phosphatidylinositol 4-kinase n=1 Tax=Salvia splendens TaxID=180675 RepID=A0A8X8YYJ1_SALSN|nr:hypothetical protein SASPL_155924 [Salvia splendens]